MAHNVTVAATKTFLNQTPAVAPTVIFVASADGIFAITGSILASGFTEQSTVGQLSVSWTDDFGAESQSFGQLPLAFRVVAGSNISISYTPTLGTPVPANIYVTLLKL